MITKSIMAKRYVKHKGIPSCKFNVQELYVFSIIIYLFILPLNAINLGRFGSLIRIFAFVPIIVSIFGTPKIIIKGPLIGHCLFVIFASCSVIWSVNFSLSLSRSVGYILLFALLISGSQFEYSDTDIKKIKNALIWSSRLTAVVMITFGRFIQGRLWLHGIITEDPNYICAYLIFGVVFSLEKVLTFPKLHRKILGLTELALYLFLVFLTGSRGGLLAVLGAAFTYFLFYQKASFKNIFKKLFMLLIMLGLFVVLLQFLPEYLQSRFTIESVVKGGGSGRMEIWGNGIDLYKNGGLFRQIFGIGTATTLYRFNVLNYSRPNVMHNMFLETLVELGVIGLILYTITIFFYLKCAYKKNNMFAFAVVAGMIVMSLSTSIYKFKPYYNIMLFIIMIINVNPSPLSSRSSISDVKDIKAL